MAWSWIWSHVRGQPFAALAAVLVFMLVGLLVASALAWQQGLQRVAAAGMDSEKMYLLARGSEDAMERSVIDAAAERAIRAQFGNQQAAELMHMGVLEFNGANRRVNWRGVEAATPSIRALPPLAAGAWPKDFSADNNEVVIGYRLARELGVQLDDTLTFLQTSLRVRGILSPNMDEFAGEVWLPLSALQSITGRNEISAFVFAQENDELTFLLFTRPDFGVVGVAEADYLAVRAAGLAPLAWVAWIVAGLLTVAAVLGLVSAAVSLAESRRRELATVRSVGVSLRRLSCWIVGEYALCAVFAAGIAALCLWAMHGSVWRLATVSPMIVVNSTVLLTLVLTILVALIMFVIPALMRLYSTPLSVQLRD